MARVTLSRLATVIGITALQACNCGTQPLQVTSGLLSLPQTNLQFKNVCIGDTVSHPFTINNDARAPLTIESIVISASSFQITPEQQLPVTIAAEGSLTFNVAFTPPANATGGENYAATMTITSNAKTNPSAVATLQGSVFDGDPMYPKKFDATCLCDRTSPQVACGLTGSPDGGISADDPCALLTYVDVSDGTTLSRTVTLTNQGCQPLTVNASLYDSDNNSMSDSNTALFSIGTSSPITIQGGQSQDVTVTFSPTGKQQLSPNVRLKLASDAQNPVGSNMTPGVDDIGLIANSVEPQLIVSTTSMAFFSTPMGKSTSQTFTVSNAGNSPLQVNSIALQNDPGTSDFALQPPNGGSPFTLAATGDPSGGDTRTETVTWTPSKSSTQHAVVVIQASGAMAKIDLYGGINAVMTVQWLDDMGNLQPPPINFGMTPTGAMGLTKTVRLTNTGSADLNVTAVATHDVSNTNPSTSFSVQGFTPGTLMPMQTMDFTVVFNDDVRIAGDTGKLDITSNDAVDVLNDNGVRVVDLLSSNTADFPPIACIKNPPASVAPCGMLTLDGSCTMAAAGQTGDTITYQWKITGPTGTTAYLSMPTAPQTQVLSMKAGCDGPDIVGTYTVTLTASDQYPGNVSAPATATINVQ